MAVAVYAFAREIPEDDHSGLARQIKDAAASVPAIIASAYGVRPKEEFSSSLYEAIGKIAELETYFTLAVRLKLVERDKAKQVWRLSQDVGKMIEQLADSINK